LLFAFFALISADCITGVDTTAYNAYTSCQSLVLAGTATAATKAASICSCINTMAAASSTNCDTATITIDGLCAAATALSGIGVAGTYDFGTCNTCANPPASPLLPTACSRCIMNLVSCVSTGYYGLATYPAIAYMALNGTCKCVGQFYSCFSGCGSPGSQYINQYCNTYSFCNCDGSYNTGRAAAVVTYLKTLGFTTFHAYFVSKSGAVSIDCITKTAAAGSNIDGTRFFCDIDFGGTSVSYANVHVWIEGYLGKTVNFVLGQIATAPLGVSLKRDSEEIAVSSTYTFQVNSGAKMSVFGGALLMALAAFFAF